MLLGSEMAMPSHERIPKFSSHFVNNANRHAGMASSITSALCCMTLWWSNAMSLRSLLCLLMSLVSPSASLLSWLLACRNRFLMQISLLKIRSWDVCEFKHRTPHHPFFPWLEDCHKPHSFNIDVNKESKFRRRDPVTGSFLSGCETCADLCTDPKAKVSRILWMLRIWLSLQGTGSWSTPWKIWASFNSISWLNSCSSPSFAMLQACLRALALWVWSLLSLLSLSSAQSVPHSMRWDACLLASPYRDMQCQTVIFWSHHRPHAFWSHTWYGFLKDQISI